MTSGEQMLQRDSILIAFLEALPDIAFIKDDEMKLIHGNAAYCRMMGLPLEELVGRDGPDLLPPELAGQCRASNRRVLETGEKIVVTETMGERIFETTKFVFEIAPSRRAFCSICREITDRERLEKELRESRRHYRSLVEMPGIQFCRWLPDTTLTFVSRAYAAAYGGTPAELVGQRWLELVPDDERAAVRMIVEELVLQPRARTYEHAVETVDGLRQITWTDWPILARDGRLVAFQSIGIDTTEMAVARRALAKQQSMIDALLDATTDAVFIKDREGRYLYFNAAAEKMTGKRREEVLGQDDTFLFAAPEARAVMNGDQRAMNVETPSTIEATLTLVDGVRHHFLTTKGQVRDENGAGIGIFGISRDITDYKKMEEKLLQVQRLESVGRLAGGIAHDFNNLITIISNCAELLAAHDCDRGRADISEIRNAAIRAADLTRQLLAFSRRQLLEKRPINISRELDGLKRTLNRLIGEDIQLKMDFAPDLGAIFADAGQLEQIILNLAVNARDAMPEGGLITVAAANRTITTALKNKLFDVPPGDYVEVRFSDTGTGIAAEAQALIFDPFYTTKAPGMGTGLGLATVYGIVKQCRGNIWVYSEEGQGTTFKIYLPRVDKAVEGEKNKGVKGEARGGSETILVVEDEESVRLLATRVLQGHGYRVLTALDGQEALEVV